MCNNSEFPIAEFYIYKIIDYNLPRIYINPMNTADKTTSLTAISFKL